jgi:endonuclease G
VKREAEVPLRVAWQPPAARPTDSEQQLGFDAASEWVAGRKHLGVDSCNGDSGGPAYIAAGGRFKVAGLTSRATREASVPCGDGGIYTRIDAHLDWIRQELAGAGISF